MNDQGKLPHSIASAFLSVSSSGSAFLEAHVNTIAIGLSIVAGIYSMYATYLTIRVKRKQLRSMDDL